MRSYSVDNPPLQIMDYYNGYDNSRTEGRLLAEYMPSGPLPLRHGCRTALQLAKSLADLHARGLIHGHISPAAVMLGAAAESAAFVSPGAAPLAAVKGARQKHPLTGPEISPYSAPEQTGRINIPVDYRADLYALGVLLYELFCGRLPFTAANSHELAHKIVALRPVPAHEANPSVPVMISRIIARLMEKMPEDRYNSAAGLAFDLSKCLVQLDAAGCIAEFELGRGDMSGIFEIPAALYGREKDIQTLLSCVADSGFPEQAGVILVGGHSGSGKTSLVHEACRLLAEQYGPVLRGKFDQYQRSTPYAAFLQAIDEWCLHLLSEPDSLIREREEEILTLPVLQVQALLRAVPQLDLIMRQQKETGHPMPDDEERHLKEALGNFIKAIGSPRHPLILFLDDVQWADMGSLRLLEDLATDDSLRGVMFICAYRDNETDLHHPFMQAVGKIETYGVNLKSLHVRNLDVHAVAAMIARILGRHDREVNALAQNLHRQTGGNPFHLIELLKQCHRKGTLYYETQERQWKWIALAMEAGGHEPLTDERLNSELSGILQGTIAALPTATQQLMRYVACMSDDCRLESLMAVSGQDGTAILEILQPAIAGQIIRHSSRGLEESRFYFSHDRFQQSVYSSLPDGEKQNIHLFLARYYEAMQQPADDNRLFSMAEHYSKALELLTGKRDIKHVNKILFKAALRARIAGVYDTACHYLEQIMAARRQYGTRNLPFNFTLAKEYHIVMCGLARFEEADIIYARIERMARDPLELTESCCRQIVSLSVRGRYDDAIRLGLSQLDGLGLAFPWGHVEDIVQQEIDRYYEYERSGRIRRLEELDEAADPVEEAIAKVMNKIVPAAFFYDLPTAHWAIMVTINRMLQTGITAEALQLYVDLTLLLIPHRQDYLTGWLAGVKALEIAERNNLESELYRIYHVYSLFSLHWQENLAKAVDYAHRAYAGNLKLGEFEFACYSFYTSQAAILECCQSLDELEHEVHAALRFAGKVNNLHAQASYVIFRQLLQALRGHTAGSFDDGDFDQDKHEGAIQSNKMALCYFYIYRALSAVLFGDFRTALDLTDKAQPLLGYITGFYPVALHNFLQSLAVCRTLDDRAEPDEASRLHQILYSNQAWLYQRIRTGGDGAVNFRHLYDLIEAEIKFRSGQSERAAALYDQAIEGAKAVGRHYHYALFCELAGTRLASRSPARAAACLRDAHDAFSSWGAAGKTADMERQYAAILGGGGEGEPNRSPQLGSDSGIIPAAGVEMNAVIQTAQILAHAVRQEELIRRLMIILLEAAGAQILCYVTGQDGQYVLRAACHMGEDITCIIEETGADESTVPVKVLNVAERTGQTIILDNAAESGLYGQDAYIRARQIRSVLCMPVMSKGTIAGLLYAENNAIAGAFSKQHVDTLRSISAQLALVMENALLNTELAIAEEQYRLVAASPDRPVPSFASDAELALLKEYLVTGDPRAADVTAVLADKARKVYRDDAIQTSCAMNSVLISLSQSLQAELPWIGQFVIGMDDGLFAKVRGDSQDEVSRSFAAAVSSAAAAMVPLVRVASCGDIAGRLQTYVLTNIDENITLASAAKALFVNRTYLSTVFKQKTGVAVKDYIMSIKMARAKALLTQSDLKISDVAQSLGFDDEDHFTRVFKKAAGCTPRKYRATINIL